MGDWDQLEMGDHDQLGMSPDISSMSLSRPNVDEGLGGLGDSLVTVWGTGTSLRWGTTTSSECHLI